MAHLPKVWAMNITLQQLKDTKNRAWATWESSLVKVLQDASTKTMSERDKSHSRWMGRLYKVALVLGTVLPMSLLFAAVMMAYGGPGWVVVWCLGVTIASSAGLAWATRLKNNTPFYRLDSDVEHHFLKKRLRQGLLTCLAYAEHDDSKDLMVQMGKAVEQEILPVASLQALEQAILQCPFSFLDVQGTFDHVLEEVKVSEPAYVFEKTTPHKASLKG